MFQTTLVVKKDKYHLVNFRGQAGNYRSPKEHVNCLYDSLKKGHPVKVRFDRKLNIKFCEKFSRLRKKNMP